MNKHNIKVGQELWFVSERGFRVTKTAKVERIGRKWAYFHGSDDRLDIDSLSVYYPTDASYRVGRCYLSESEWRVDQDAAAAWRKLRDAVSRQPRPDNISAKQIREAAALLGLGEFMKED